MPNYIVHLYHHARRHGESNTMPFLGSFLHRVPHSRNNLFDIQPVDILALPKPNVRQSTCYIVLISNIFQSTHCKYLILCRACNILLPYIHTSSRFVFALIIADCAAFFNHSPGEKITACKFFLTGCYFKDGAGNRGRTCTGLPMDPKSIASANSAIPAIDRLFAV